MIYNITSYIYY